MDRIKVILKNNTNFTPYKFYNEFLQDVADFYRQGNKEVIAFKLFEYGDDSVYDSSYRIDPIVIPLLLSLFEQLSKYHKRKLPFLLFNNVATISVLEFLFRSDFFFIVGNNENPNFPKGRNILDFNSGLLGSFKGKVLRNEHRVRSYSLEQDSLAASLKEYNSEEQKRDFLISHYTYKVREHFGELLFDNEFTTEVYNTYIDILSELITNSVLHSGANSYALMFVDRFKTKFSISDNGVGFGPSMKLKQPTFYYQKDSLKKNLEEKISITQIPTPVLDNLFTIFETLYYSSLKDRHGIFDLMITVVLESKGYFRIHNENSQIIISNRMMDELQILSHLRAEIYETHTKYNLGQIDEKLWTDILTNKSAAIRTAFLIFCEKAIAKYSNDIQYSSIRFFKVRFRGVHIEVEIPNTLSDDNINN